MSIIATASGIDLQNEFALQDGVIEFVVHRSDVLFVVCSIKNREKLTTSSTSDELRRENSIRCSNCLHLFSKIFSPIPDAKKPARQLPTTIPDTGTYGRKFMN